MTITATERVTSVLANSGYALWPGAVSEDAVNRARRELLLAIRENGLSLHDIAEWQSSTFFPWLRDEDWVWNLLPHGAGAAFGERRPGDLWCDPQLLIRLPDRAKHWPITYHKDTEPPWANGRRYKGIVGVSLTDTGPQDGGTLVVPGSHRGEPRKPVQIVAKAGDALLFDPLLEHAGTLNRGSSIRMAVFFRLLGGAR